MIALAKELSRQRSCAIRACEDAFLASRGSPARSNALRILDANECLRLRQESRRSVLVQFAYVRAGLAGRCIDEVRRALKEFSDVALLGCAGMPLGVGEMRAAEPLAAALAILLSDFVAGFVYARNALTGLFLRLNGWSRSEEHTSELQSPCNLVCRLLLEKKKKNTSPFTQLSRH